ncbi:MAG: hypothetical protein ACP5HK_05200 [Acidilobus sp.]
MAERSLVLASGVLALVGGLIGLAVGGASLYVTSLGLAYFNETLHRVLSAYPFVAVNITPQAVTSMYSMMRALGVVLTSTGLVGLAVSVIVITIVRPAISRGELTAAASHCAALGVLLVVLGLISIYDFVQLVLFAVAGALLLVERGRLRREAALGLPVNPTA